MKSQANISKSVARTFRVLELFRELRRPLTAAQIQHALGLPQPSARVLLKEMADLGYLAYTMPARTYFPTSKLCTLGEWIGNGRTIPEALLRLVDRVSAACEETASLSTATAGHVEVLHVRRAGHALGLQVSPGMGSALWRSAAGRTLLSLRTEAEVEEFFDTLEARDAPRGRRLRDTITAQIAGIRDQGYFVGYDILLKGVGAVCMPLPATAIPLVLTVAGGKDRMQAREKSILRSLRAALRHLPTMRERPCD